MGPYPEGMSTDEPSAPALSESDERGGEPPLAGPAAPADDLLTQLEVVETQPLADRAAAYEAIHDHLAQRLEQSPTSVQR